MYCWATNLANRFHESIKGWDSGATSLKIVGAAVRVGTMTGLVSVSFFVRELLVANWFGTGNELEAYLMAFVVPAFVMDVMRASFAAAAIPAVATVLARDGKPSVQRLISQMICLTLLVLASTAVVLGIFGKELLSLLATGFDAQKMDLTTTLYYIMLPCIVISGTSVIWASLLNLEKRFYVAALTPASAPICCAVLLTFFVDTWGVLSLALGTILGLVLEWALLISCLWKLGYSLMPRWTGMDGDIWTILGQFGAISAAAALSVVPYVVDQAMAAALGPGSLASLNYGNKLVGSICALVPMAIGTAVLPYVSDYAAVRDAAGLGTLLTRFSKLTLLVTVPLWIAIAVTSEDVVRLVFQRGAFSDYDTVVAARIQALSAAYLPFVSLTALGNRILSATLMNSAITVVSAISVAFRVGLNCLLVPVVGLSGIALSMSVVGGVTAALTHGAVRWRLYHFSGGHRPEQVEKA